MKAKRLATVVMLMLAAGTVANAQLNLKNLKDAAKKAVNNPSAAASNTGTKAAASTPAAKGKTLYVSATTGSARADGLSATLSLPVTHTWMMRDDTVISSTLLFLRTGRFPLP